MKHNPQKPASTNIPEDIHASGASDASRKGASDNAELLNPPDLEKLNDKQREEIRDYLATRIKQSDELLGAVTRKIKDILARDKDKA